MQSQQGRSAPRTPHAPCNMIPVYRTLKELKESSPSRKHGLSEEDEERWRRAAINLMVNAAVKINMQVLFVNIPAALLSLSLLFLFFT